MTCRSVLGVWQRLQRDGYGANAPFKTSCRLSQKTLSRRARDAAWRFPQQAAAEGGSGGLECFPCGSPQSFQQQMLRQYAEQNVCCCALCSSPVWLPAAVSQGATDSEENGRLPAMTKPIPGHTSRSTLHTTSGSQGSNISGAKANTILLCSQCRRMFHVDCYLQQAAPGPLPLPPQDNHRTVWFHSTQCRDLHAALTAAVAEGEREAGGGYSWQILKQTGEGYLERDNGDVLVDDEGPLPGEQAYALLSQVFDSEEVEYDLQYSYVVLLKHRQEPVTACALEVYGREAAHMVMVVTGEDHQGQGHARKLFQLTCQLLSSLHVALLVLHSKTPELEDMWRGRFGCRPLTGPERHYLEQQYQLTSCYEDEDILLGWDCHRGEGANEK